VKRASLSSLARVALCAVVVATVGAAPSAAAQKAYVVASDQPAFAEAARAALEALGGDGALLRADDSAKSVVGGAEIVIAVGPLAERVVGSSINGSAHAIAVLTPRAGSLPAGRTLSVPLYPSAQDVLSLVRRLLPSVQKLAVFPAPGRGDGEIAAAAREAGITVAMPRSSEPFAAALDRLVEVADAVWIEDVAALPAGGAALVVKKATDAHKQVVGPNRATVLQGAFFAVVPDPVAHGRAAGEAAARMLRGEDLRSVSPPTGRVVVNGALSRTMNVKLPPDIARRAETVE
jgi:hypothetical protein